MTPPRAASDKQPLRCLHGPRFWSGDRRWRSTVACVDGQIIGWDAARSAQAVELPEGFAFPGFIDTHLHLGRLGQRPDALSISPNTSTAKVIAQVRAAAASTPEGAWIVGRGWRTLDGVGSCAPSHEVLSSAAPGHPVALVRVDEHALWVNQAALRQANITADTPDPEGGAIRRDAEGTPTGFLLDNAMRLIQRFLPAPTSGELEQVILEECDALLRVGITCAHEMAVDAPLLAALQRLEASGRLPLRVRAYLLAGDDRLVGEVVDPPSARRLRRAGLKLFADGALGSRGARLSRAYEDGGRGVQPDPSALFEQALSRARQGGWQVAVHAIGDAAVREVIEALVAEQPRGARWRVEHIQNARTTDIEAMARAGLCATVQPIHAAQDLPWAAPVLGEDLLPIAYPWRRLRRAGVTLGLGSDHPIESPDVRLTLLAATTRAATGRVAPALPGRHERLTRGEALDAYWRGAARLSFDEGWLGVLAPRMRCDLSVWDTDLTSCDVSALPRARCLATVVEGEVVWRREGV